MLTKATRPHTALLIGSRCFSKFNSTRLGLIGALAAILSCFCVDPAAAQTGGLAQGEAFVTRFSGVTQGSSGQRNPVINVNGASGSIIDLRAPGFPPMGIHWMTEPQSNPVTAAQVGQVFGVVLDDANPPNIYLSATSAFGLHLSPGTS
jgi:hypothetical protein